MVHSGICYIRVNVLRVNVIRVNDFRVDGFRVNGFQGIVIESPKLRKFQPYLPSVL